MLGRICAWDVGALNGGIILGGPVVKHTSKLNVNSEYLNKHPNCKQLNVEFVIKYDVQIWQVNII